VNISVTLQDDNKAVLFVSLDRSDKNYYACDAGCLDFPVQLGFVFLFLAYIFICLHWVHSFTGMEHFYLVLDSGDWSTVNKQLKPFKYHIVDPRDAE
jgi:hypothetical protein